jgi:hypothetical protein
MNQLESITEQLEAVSVFFEELLQSGESLQYAEELAA